MRSIKKYFFAIIVGVIITIGGGLIYVKNQPRVILFYGDTCAHCKVVDEYISAGGLREKVKFEELEVFNNEKNAALLGKYAQGCGIDSSQGVGVPFFFDGQNCLVGDQKIIDYFKTK